MFGIVWKKRKNKGMNISMKRDFQLENQVTLGLSFYPLWMLPK